jgi:hypothetical protein
MVVPQSRGCFAGWVEEAEYRSFIGYIDPHFDAKTGSAKSTIAVRLP